MVRDTGGARDEREPRHRLRASEGGQGCVVISRNQPQCMLTAKKAVRMQRGTYVTKVYFRESDYRVEKDLVDTLRKIDPDMSYIVYPEDFCSVRLADVQGLCETDITSTHRNPTSTSRDSDGKRSGSKPLPDMARASVIQRLKEELMDHFDERKLRARQVDDAYEVMFWVMRSLAKFHENDVAYVDIKYNNVMSTFEGDFRFIDAGFMRRIFDSDAQASYLSLYRYWIIPPSASVMYYVNRRERRREKSGGARDRVPRGEDLDVPRIMKSYLDNLDYRSRGVVRVAQSFAGDGFVSHDGLEAFYRRYESTKGEAARRAILMSTMKANDVYAAAIMMLTIVARRFTTANYFALFANQGMRALIAQCLSHDPAARPTADQFVKRIRRVISENTP